MHKSNNNLNEIEECICDLKFHGIIDTLWVTTLKERAFQEDMVQILWGVLKSCYNVTFFF